MSACICDGVSSSDDESGTEDWDGKPTKVVYKNSVPHRSQLCDRYLAILDERDGGQRKSAQSYPLGKEQSKGHITSHVITCMGSLHTI